MSTGGDRAPGRDEAVLDGAGRFGRWTSVRATGRRDQTADRRLCGSGRRCGGGGRGLRPSTPSWRSSAGIRWETAGTSSGTWRDRVIVYLVGMPAPARRRWERGLEPAGRAVHRPGRRDRAGRGTIGGELFADQGRRRSGPRGRALLDASRHDPAVVACGGGVVLEPANRITLRNTGVCVFIDVPLEQLRARIHGRRTSADPRRRDWAPPGRA